MSVDKPKNPWAHLDEVERTMDPLERNRLYLERKVSALERENINNERLVTKDLEGFNAGGWFRMGRNGPFH